MESTKLRQTFGPYSASIATKAFECVQDFVALLDDDLIKEENEEEGSSKSKKTYFGQKSKVNIGFENKNFDELFSEYSDANDTNIQADNFVELFKDKLNVNSSKQQLEDNTKNNSQPQASNGFSSSWLFNQCEKHLSQQTDSALNITDLTSAVFEILNSTRSNDEIQNDMFDLLGFDAFDLILKILEHRNDIIQAAMQSNNENLEYQHIDPSRKMVKPVPGQQVTIQSVHEKNLLRKMVKEERKLMRRDPELYNELFNVNREQEEIIRTQPLFRKLTSSSTQQFPFVFDEFAQRKLASAYVGGTKILLPESAEKSSYNKYDEVDIPATGVQPPSHLNLSVDIKSLDEVIFGSNL